MVHENKVWKMPLRLRLEPSAQVYLPCLPVNPGCDLGLCITSGRPLGAFFSWWFPAKPPSQPYLSPGLTLREMSRSR